MTQLTASQPHKVGPIWVATPQTGSRLRPACALKHYGSYVAAYPMSVKLDVKLDENGIGDARALRSSDAGGPERDRASD